MKKIYFDTEFTGLHKDTDLLSIGCISDDGIIFYGEIEDYDNSKVDDWVQENVIDNMYGKRGIAYIDIINAEDTVVSGTKREVIMMLKSWLEQFGDEEIQLVSDVCHYDMVLFIDLFGTAFDLPKNVSAVCHDINQDIALLYKISDKEAFDKSREEIIRDYAFMLPEGDKHNSLYDAKVIKTIDLICQMELFMGEFEFDENTDN